MHGEASVCDPFDIPDADRQIPAKDNVGMGSSPSTPGLDVTGASISSATGEDGNRDRDAPSIVLPHQDASYISHIALDIGGSLIKLVYFSSDKPGSDEKPTRSSSNGSSSSHTGGNLHFVKFETSKIGQCLDFIKSKNLHHCPDNGQGEKPQMRVQATGGGAFKYADMFQEKLGLILEKEDEMECLVGGCNFLLKAIRHEAFTYENGALNFVTNTADSDLYPYLLVNIGSGVSLLKVEGDGQYERVSGSSLGGGTFWGLCRLLTRCKSFDEMLELSMRGDNSKVDMLVGDIYGDRDYSNIGLSATTIASSFGKVVSEGKDLEDVDPADIALALCRMVSYNIGHLAYLNAKRYGLPRVLFGGFFIRGHPYTMETISFAIKFWSKGEMAALFLRHEGFLGAMGAFLKVHPMTSSSFHTSSTKEPRKVRARFVERFSMGAPFSAGEVQGPAFAHVSHKVDWVEKFVRVGTAATEAARSQEDQAQQSSMPDPMSRGNSLTTNDMGDMLHPSSPSSLRMNLHVGVLHYDPSFEPFPLLTDPVHYEPNTVNISDDKDMLDYWLNILTDSVSTIMAKAIASEGGKADARRRAAAFGRALAGHVTKLRSEPSAYGGTGLSELLGMREECLREFGFKDVYRLDKEREHAAALEVLPDLLNELDQTPPKARLTSLVEGILAGNIFDWGAKATVDLYYNGTILEIYRKARNKLAQRPWRVDDLDAFCDRWFDVADGDASEPGKPYKRVIMFVDNAGADILLGMLPLARELLRRGTEVVLVGNTLPAINDITVSELVAVLEDVGHFCPVIKAAKAAGEQAQAANGGQIPPYPGLDRRIPSTARLADLEASQQDLPNHQPPGLHNGANAAEETEEQLEEESIEEREFKLSVQARRKSPLDASSSYRSTGSSDDSSDPDNPGAASPSPSASPGKKADATLASLAHRQQASKRNAKLFVVSNGQGSPCLDLRRVPDTLADATVGADLVILEGMGRSIITNYHTKFKCDVLKLAMIKNQFMAEKLFQGNVYDCMCKYEPAVSQSQTSSPSPKRHPQNFSVK